MQLILGMQCMHDGSLAASPDRQAHLADLVVDPRWLHRFKLITVQYLPQMPRRSRFPGSVAATKLRVAAEEALSSPSAGGVMFSMNRKEVSDHIHFKVETGRNVVYPDSRFSVNAKWRVPEDATAETTAAAWIELQHAVIETIDATHGVLMIATDAWVMTAELFLETASVDGKLMHPHPEEISSYQVKRDQLGEQYIRKPRWGTYLKPAHVAAVGGRDKILAVVNPPVVRDVGNLLYVQLSERIADATADETRRRWRAFVDLVAPITMPPLET